MTDLKITIRELRALLFEIDAQDLTVRELRARLVQEDDQDAAVSYRLLHTLSREVAR